MMSVCRICLCSKPKKNITQLKNYNLSGEWIVLFCLGIQIQDAENAKFCIKCFRKIVQFHNFKTLAIKNQVYWSSPGTEAVLKKNVKKEAASAGPVSDEDDKGPYVYEEEPMVYEEESLVNEPQIIMHHELRHDINQVEVSDDEPLSNFIKPEFEIFESQSNEHLKHEEVSNDELLSEITKHELQENYMLFSKSEGIEHVKQEELSEDKPLSKITEHGFRENYILLSKSKARSHNKIFNIKTKCNEDEKSVIVMAPSLETLKPKKQQHSVQCAYCNKFFANKTSIKMHIKSFHTEKDDDQKVKEKIKCQQCSRLFSSKITMEEHMKATHLGIKSQCPVCKKYFYHEYLKYHIKIRHEVDSLLFQCDNCSRRFLTKTLLRRHMTCHSSEKPYSCEICSAKFRLKYSVYLHKRQVHDKDRNHVCHICSMRYVTNSRLQQHLRKHAPAETRKRPEQNSKEVLFKKVICPDCGKPLASEKTLIEHRKLHTGEKNVKCKVCNSSFASKKYLLCHMKTHTQERKFGCKYCPASFVRSGGRRRHEVELHLQPAGQRIYAPKPRVNRKRTKRAKTQNKISSKTSENSAEAIQALRIKIKKS